MSSCPQWAAQGRKASTVHYRAARPAQFHYRAARPAQLHLTLAPLRCKNTITCYAAARDRRIHRCCWRIWSCVRPPHHFCKMLPDWDTLQQCAALCLSQNGVSRAVSQLVYKMYACCCTLLEPFLSQSCGLVSTTLEPTGWSQLLAFTGEMQRPQAG